MNNKKRIIDYYSDYENQELEKDEIIKIEHAWISAFCDFSKQPLHDKRELFRGSLNKQDQALTLNKRQI